MKEKIRIAFIGAGNICRSMHLPQLVKIPEVEVVTVCNRTRDSSESVAREFGIPDVAEDWNRVVERDDIDAVFIGTWPYMHRELSVAALKGGKHVFCQARMAMDLAEAKEMVKTAREHPYLVNMICPPPLRQPHEPFIREFLSSDALGPITSVDLVALTGENRARDSISWREDVNLSGRQALGLGILTEVLNAWLGPYKRLSAETAIPIPTKRGKDGKERKIRVPQVISITGSLASGALISEHHSGLVDHPEVPSRPLTIWGMNGTLRYEFVKKTIEYAPSGESLAPLNVPEKSLRPWRVEQEFISAVQNAMKGKTWRVSPDFEEGLLYMRKVEAVHVSAAAGRAVDPGEL